MNRLSLFAFSAWLGACAPEHVLVLVSVEDVQSQELCVSVKLDGRSTPQGDFRVRDNLSRFAIRLPNAAASRGNLEVKIRGLSETGVVTQRGTAQLELPEGGLELTTAVTLSPDSKQEGWVVVPTPTTKNLHSIFGTGPNDIYAAGDYGALIHFDGTSWTAVDLSNANTHFRSVWTRDPGFSFVAGNTNRIWKKTGTKWQETQPGGGNVPDYRALWGSALNNVWLVGDGGAMRHYDGSTWNILPAVVPYDLLGIWGSAADDIWAVGDFPNDAPPAMKPATLLHFDGTAWTAPANDVAGSGGMRAIWGSDASHAWAVGDMLQIVKWDGSTWSTDPYTLAPPILKRNLKGIWGTDANNVWAVGDQVILKWNGTTWNFEASNPRRNLDAVWGTDPCNVWAVGEAGVILHSPQ